MIWRKILTQKPLKIQYQFIKEVSSQYSVSFLYAPAPKRENIDSTARTARRRLQDENWDT